MEYTVDELSKKFNISDKKRLARQLDLYNKWKFGDKTRSIRQANSLILAKTGFGKSIIGLLAALENESKGRNTLIIVPTKPLKKDWEDKIVKWKLQQVDIQVVNSVTVNKTIEWIKSLKYSLVVIDEVHLVAKARVFSKVLEISSPYFMGLTATLPEDDVTYFKLLSKLPIIDRVGWEEVLENNYISDFEISILPLYCTPLEAYQMDMWHNQFWKSLATLGSFDIGIKILSDKDFRRSFSMQKGINENELFGIAKRLRGVVSARQDYFYNHELKKNKIIEIVNQYPDKNIITFSQSISFVEDVTERLGNISCAYHSKQTDKDLEKMLNNFKHHRGKIKVVNTAMALNQGIDIPKIDLAIISSWFSTSITMHQRIGRACRISKNKDKAVIIITPISRLDGKKTQDEKWLEKALIGIPKEKIKYVKSIEEIN